MKQHWLNMNTTRVIRPIDPPKRPFDDNNLGRLPRNPLVGLPNYVQRRRSKYQPDGLNRRDKQALAMP